MRNLQRKNRSHLLDFGYLSNFERFRSSGLFKTIALIVVFTFVNQNLSYANGIALMPVLNSSVNPNRALNIFIDKMSTSAQAWEDDNYDAWNDSSYQSWDSGYDSTAGAYTYQDYNGQNQYSTISVNSYTDLTALDVANPVSNYNNAVNTQIHTSDTMTAYIDYNTPDNSYMQSASGQRYGADNPYAAPVIMTTSGVEQGIAGTAINQQTMTGYMALDFDSSSAAPGFKGLATFDDDGVFEIGGMEREVTNRSRQNKAHVNDMHIAQITNPNFVSAVNESDASMPNAEGLNKDEQGNIQRTYFVNSTDNDAQVEFSLEEQGHAMSFNSGGGYMLQGDTWMVHTGDEITGIGGTDAGQRAIYSTNGADAKFQVYSTGNSYFAANGGAGSISNISNNIEDGLTINNLTFTAGSTDMAMLANAGMLTDTAGFNAQAIYAESDMTKKLGGFDQTLKLYEQTTNFTGTQGGGFVSDTLINASHSIVNNNPSADVSNFGFENSMNNDFTSIGRIDKTNLQVGIIAPDVFSVHTGALAAIAPYDPTAAAGGNNSSNNSAANQDAFTTTTNGVYLNNVTGLDFFDETNQDTINLSQGDHLFYVGANRAGSLDVVDFNTGQYEQGAIWNNLPSNFHIEDGNDENNHFLAADLTGSNAIYSGGVAFVGQKGAENNFGIMGANRLFSQGRGIAKMEFFEDVNHTFETNTEIKGIFDSTLSEIAAARNAGRDFGQDVTTATISTEMNLDYVSILTNMDDTFDGLEANALLDKSWGETITGTKKHEVDYDLSFASGRFTQSFGDETLETGYVQDLYFDKGLEQAGFIVHGQMFVPEKIQNAGGEGGAKEADFAADMTLLGRRQGALIGSGKDLNGQSYELFERINVADGTSAFMLNGIGGDLISANADGEFGINAGLDINTVALDDNATWRGASTVHWAQWHNGHTDIMVHNSEMLVANSTTIDTKSGLTTRTSLGGVRSDQEEFSLADRNAFQLEQKIMANPILTREGNRNIVVDQTWKVLTQQNAAITEDNTKGWQWAAPENSSILFGMGMGLQESSMGVSRATVQETLDRAVLGDVNELNSLYRGFDVKEVIGNNAFNRQVVGQSTEATQFTDGVARGNIFHYGIKDLSFTTQVIDNTNPVEEPEPIDESIPEYLRNPDLLPKEQGRNGFDIGYNNVLRIKGHENEVIAVEGIMPTILNLGVDEDHKASLDVQTLHDAGGITWADTQLTRDGDAHDLERLDGVYAMEGEEAAGVYNVSKERAVPYQRIMMADGLEKTLYLGGHQRDYFTFQRGTGRALGAAGLYETRRTDGGYIEARRNESEMAANGMYSVIETKTKVVPEVVMQNEDGQWDAAKGIYVFDESLRYNIEQKVTGGINTRSGFNEKEIVAQANVGNAGKHFLIRDLDFIEPNKEYQNSVELRDEPESEPFNGNFQSSYENIFSGDWSSSIEGLYGWEQNDDEFSLGYNLYNKDRYSFATNYANALSAGDALMPVKLDIGEGGTLAFDVIDRAKGLKYNYESFDHNDEYVPMQSSDGVIDQRHFFTGEDYDWASELDREFIQDSLEKQLEEQIGHGGKYKKTYEEWKAKLDTIDISTEEGYDTAIKMRTALFLNSRGGADWASSYLAYKNHSGHLGNDLAFAWRNRDFNYELFGDGFVSLGDLDELLGRTNVDIEDFGHDVLKMEISFVVEETYNRAMNGLTMHSWYQPNDERIARERADIQAAFNEFRRSDGMQGAYDNFRADFERANLSKGSIGLERANRAALGGGAVKMLLGGYAIVGGVILSPAAAIGGGVFSVGGDVVGKARGWLDNYSRGDQGPGYSRFQRDHQAMVETGVSRYIAQDMWSDNFAEKGYQRWNAVGGYVFDKGTDVLISGAAGRALNPLGKLFSGAAGAADDIAISSLGNSQVVALSDLVAAEATKQVGWAAFREGAKQVAIRSVAIGGVQTVGTKALNMALYDEGLTDDLGRYGALFLTSTALAAATQGVSKINTGTSTAFTYGKTVLSSAVSFAATDVAVNNVVNSLDMGGTFGSAMHDNWESAQHGFQTGVLYGGFMGGLGVAGKFGSKFGSSKFNSKFTDKWNGLGKSFGGKVVQTGVKAAGFGAAGVVGGYGFETVMSLAQEQGLPEFSWEKTTKYGMLGMYVGLGAKHVNNINVGNSAGNFILKRAATASITGTGNVALDAIYGNFDEDLTPGKIAISFVKGWAYGEMGNFAARNIGQQLKEIGGRSQEFVSGQQQKVTLFGKEITVRDGANKLLVESLEGAAKWPIVSSAMGVATPLWDMTIGTVELAADVVATDKTWKDDFGKDWVSLSRTTAGGLAQVMTREAMIENIKSVKHGRIMSPMIKTFSRGQIDPTEQQLMKAFEGKTLTHRFASSSVGRVVGAPSRLVKGIGQKLGMKMQQSQTWGGRIGYGLGAEVVGLAQVAGVTTGIDRGFQAVNRVGYYADTWTGNVDKDEVENASVTTGMGQELKGIKAYLHENYAETTGFGEAERGHLGWLVLLGKGQKNFEKFRPGHVEGNAKQSKANFENIRQHGSIEAVVRAELKNYTEARTGALNAVDKMIAKAKGNNSVLRAPELSSGKYNRALRTAKEGQLRQYSQLREAINSGDLVTVKRLALGLDGGSFSSKYLPTLEKAANRLAAADQMSGNVVMGSALEFASEREAKKLYESNADRMTITFRDQLGKTREMNVSVRNFRRSAADYIYARADNKDNVLTYLASKDSRIGREKIEYVQGQRAELSSITASHGLLAKAEGRNSVSRAQRKFLRAKAEVHQARIDGVSGREMLQLVNKMNKASSTYAKKATRINDLALTDGSSEVHSSILNEVLQNRAVVDKHFEFANVREARKVLTQDRALNTGILKRVVENRLATAVRSWRPVKKLLQSSWGRNLRATYLKGNPNSNVFIKVVDGHGRASKILVNKSALKHNAAEFIMARSKRGSNIVKKLNADVYTEVHKTFLDWDNKISSIEAQLKSASSPIEAKYYKAELNLHRAARNRKLTMKEKVAFLEADISFASSRFESIFNSKKLQKELGVNKQTLSTLKDKLIEGILKGEIRSAHLSTAEGLQGAISEIISSSSSIREMAIQKIGSQSLSKLSRLARERSKYEGNGDARKLERVNREIKQVQNEMANKLGIEKQFLAELFPHLDGTLATQKAREVVANRMFADMIQTVELKQGLKNEYAQLKNNKNRTAEQTARMREMEKAQANYEALLKQHSNFRNSNKEITPQMQLQLENARQKSIYKDILAPRSGKHQEAGFSVLGSGILAEIAIGKGKNYERYVSLLGETYINKIKNTKITDAKALVEIGRRFSEKYIKSREYQSALNEFNNGLEGKNLNFITNFEGNAGIKSILAGKLNLSKNKDALTRMMSALRMSYEMAASDFNIHGGFNNSYKKANPQLEMIAGFLREKSVNAQAGGGKTAAFSIEMFVREAGAGRSMNHMLIAKTGEGSSTVAGTKDQFKVDRLAQLFGKEMVDGVKLYKNGEISTLAQRLSEKNKVVVMEQESLGFSSLDSSNALRRAYRSQDVMRWDEFHMPFASQTSYISSKNMGINNILAQAYVKEATHAREIISQGLSGRNPKIVRRSKAEVLADKSGMSYAYDSVRNEFVMSKGLRKHLVNNKIGAEAANQFFQAEFLQVRGETYAVHKGGLVPVGAGNKEISRVFSSKSQLAALYAKEQWNNPGTVLRERLTTSTTGNTGSVPEIMKMLNPKGSNLGASGTLDSLQLMVELNIGTGIHTASTSRYDVNNTIGFKGKADKYVDFISGHIAQRIEAGNTIRQLKRDIRQSLRSTREGRRMSTEQINQRVSRRLSENKTYRQLQQRFGNDISDVGVAVLIKDSGLRSQILSNSRVKNALARSKELGFLRRDITTETTASQVDAIAKQSVITNSISFINEKGTTGINYQGNFDLMIADAHKWTTSDIKQGIARNRRSTDAGGRFIFYDKNQVRLTNEVLQTDRGRGLSSMVNGKMKTHTKDLSVINSRGNRARTRDAASLLRNAEALQAEQLSSSLIFNSREAARSRGLIEGMKQLLRNTHGAEREALQEVYDRVLDRSGNSDYSMAASRNKSAAAQMKESMTGVAREIVDVFDGIVQNRQGKYNRSTIEAARHFRNTGRDVLTNYDTIRSRSDRGYSKAETLREIVQIAKSSRVLDRITISDFTRGMDMAKQNQVVFNRVTNERARTTTREVAAKVRERVTATPQYQVAQNRVRGMIIQTGDRAAFMQTNDYVQNTPAIQRVYDKHYVAALEETGNVEVAREQAVNNTAYHMVRQRPQSDAEKSYKITRADMSIIKEDATREVDNSYQEQRDNIDDLREDVISSNGERETAALVSAVAQAMPSSPLAQQLVSANANDVSLHSIISKYTNPTDDQVRTVANDFEMASEVLAFVEQAKMVTQIGNDNTNEDIKEANEVADFMLSLVAPELNYEKLSVAVAGYEQLSEELKFELMQNNDITQEFMTSFADIFAVAIGSENAAQSEERLTNEAIAFAKEKLQPLAQSGNSFWSKAHAEEVLQSTNDELSMEDFAVLKAVDPEFNVAKFRVYKNSYNSLSDVLELGASVDRQGLMDARKAATTKQYEDAKRDKERERKNAKPEEMEQIDKAIEFYDKKINEINELKVFGQAKVTTAGSYEVISNAKSYKDLAYLYEHAAKDVEGVDQQAIIDALNDEDIAEDFSMKAMSMNKVTRDAFIKLTDLLSPDRTSGLEQQKYLSQEGALASLDLTQAVAPITLSSGEQQQYQNTKFDIYQNDFREGLARQVIDALQGIKPTAEIDRVQQELRRAKNDSDLDDEQKRKREKQILAKAGIDDKSLLDSTFRYRQYKQNKVLENYGLTLNDLNASSFNSVDEASLVEAFNIENVRSRIENLDSNASHDQVAKVMQPFYQWEISRKILSNNDKNLENLFGQESIPLYETMLKNNVISDVLSSSSKESQLSILRRYDYSDKLSTMGQINKETLNDFFKDVSFGQMFVRKVELAAPNSLINEETGKAVAAQAGADGTMKLDLGFLKFTTDKNGAARIHFDAATEYNFGTGSHELVHTYVKNIGELINGKKENYEMLKNTFSKTEQGQMYITMIEETARLAAKKEWELDYTISEMKENELIVRGVSLVDTVKGMRKQAMKSLDGNIYSKYAAETGSFFAQPAGAYDMDEANSEELLRAVNESSYEEVIQNMYTDKKVKDNWLINDFDANTIKHNERAREEQGDLLTSIGNEVEAILDSKDLLGRENYVKALLAPESKKSDENRLSKLISELRKLNGVELRSVQGNLNKLNAAKRAGDVEELKIASKDFLEDIRDNVVSKIMNPESHSQYARHLKYNEEEQSQAAVGPDPEEQEEPMAVAASALTQANLEQRLTGLDTGNDIKLMAGDLLAYVGINDIQREQLVRIQDKADNARYRGMHQRQLRVIAYSNKDLFPVSLEPLVEPEINNASSAVNRIEKVSPEEYYNNLREVAKEFEGFRGLVHPAILEGFEARQAILHTYSNHFKNEQNVARLLVPMMEPFAATDEDLAKVRLTALNHDLGKAGPDFVSAIDQASHSFFSHVSADDSSLATIVQSETLPKIDMSSQMRAVSALFGVESGAMSDIEKEGIYEFSGPEKGGLVSIESYLGMLAQLPSSSKHHLTQPETDTIRATLANIDNPFTGQRFFSEEGAKDTMRQFWNAHTPWGSPLVKDTVDELEAGLNLHHFYHSAQDFRKVLNLPDNLQRTVVWLAAADVYEALVVRSGMEHQKAMGIVRNVLGGAVDRQDSAVLNKEEKASLNKVIDAGLTMLDNVAPDVTLNTNMGPALGLATGVSGSALTSLDGQGGGSTETISSPVMEVTQDDVNIYTQERLEVEAKEAFELTVADLSYEESLDKFIELNELDDKAEEKRTVSGLVKKWVEVRDRAKVSDYAASAFNGMSVKSASRKVVTVSPQFKGSFAGLIAKAEATGNLGSCVRSSSSIIDVFGYIVEVYLLIPISHISGILSNRYGPAIVGFVKKASEGLTQAQFLSTLTAVKFAQEAANSFTNSMLFGYHAAVNPQERSATVSSAINTYNDTAVTGLLPAMLTLVNIANQFAEQSLGTAMKFNSMFGIGYNSSKKKEVKKEELVIKTEFENADEALAQWKELFAKQIIENAKAKARASSAEEVKNDEMITNISKGLTKTAQAYFKLKGSATQLRKAMRDVRTEAKKQAALEVEKIQKEQAKKPLPTDNKPLPSGLPLEAVLDLYIKIRDPKRILNQFRGVTPPVQPQPVPMGKGPEAKPGTMQIVKSN